MYKHNWEALGTQLQERSMRKKQSSNQLTWLSRILSGCKNGLENNPIPDNHWKRTKLLEPNLFNFKCKSQRISNASLRELKPNYMNCRTPSEANFRFWQFTQLYEVGGTCRLESLMTFSSKSDVFFAKIQRQVFILTKEAAL